MTYHIYTTTRLGLAGARRSEALRAPRHLGGAGAACRDRVPREVRRRQAAASRVQGAERGPVMPTKGEPIGWTPKSEEDHFCFCPICGWRFDMRDLGEVFDHL